MTFATVGEVIEQREGLALMDERTRALYVACDAHAHFEIRELQRIGTYGGIAVIVDAGDGSVAPDNPAGLWRDERLALYYLPGSEGRLEVRALRNAFPDVVHLNAVHAGEPKSLCLLQLDNDTIARRFSPAQLLNRILEWLEATAEGRLHQDDQALELIFYTAQHVVVLPADVARRCQQPGQQLRVIRGRTVDDRHLLELGFSEGDTTSGMSLTPVVVCLPSAAHGAMQRQPHTLGDVHEAMVHLGSDLLTPIREAVVAAAKGGVSSAVGTTIRVLLVLLVPRTRDGGNICRWDKVGYVLDTDLAGLGIGLGVLHRANAGSPAFPVQLIGSGALAESQTESWRAIALDAVDVRQKVGPEMARRMSGTTDTSANFTGVLAGVGALGSALADFWMRAGWGRWHFIDPDMLEPHNVVRHLARHEQVGQTKVDAVRTLTDAVYGHPDATLKSHLGRADHTDKPEIRSILESADLLVDASTTLAVPREWAAIDGLSRSASVFLTPSGQGSALLLEDAQRSTRADALEAQYYRALIKQTWGADHLASVEAIRAGAGCRDRTVVMASDQILLHAALISRRLQNKVRSAEAAIQVWCADREGANVTMHDVPVEAVRSGRAAGWRIVWDDGFLADVERMRGSKLPSETGGVLFGITDQKARSIHLVLAADEPPGSVASPTGFVRSPHGVESFREHVQLRSGLMVDYVGEWHSHPNGMGARASGDDLALIFSLAQRLNADGLPAVMLIMGDGELGIYLRQDGRDVRAI